VVVSTNLLPGVLTVHMLLAFAIIAALVYLYVKTAPGVRTSPAFQFGNTMRYALGLMIFLTLIQVLLGTQVRQQVDIIAKGFDMQQRELWVSHLGTVYKIHRSFAWLVLIGNIWTSYQLIRYMSHYFAVYRAAILLAATVLLATITGVILAYLNMPGSAQPMHLLLACLLFGVQSYLFFVLGRRTRVQTSAMASNERSR